MTLILLRQIITMFIIIVIGVIVCKAKLITERGNKDLSNLLLFMVNPILIVLSYQQEFDPEKLKKLVLLLVVSFLSFVVLIPLVYLLIGKKNDEYAIERFSAIYSNCGFFGIPLVNSIYGQEGVFYLTAYITAFNLLVWTHGIILIKGKSEKVSIREKLKDIVNPTVIACIMGVTLYVCKITIPESLYNGLDYVGKMNTPLAMLIAGAALARSNLKEVLGNKRLYYVAFIRLVLSPLIIMGILYFVPLHDMLKIIIIICSACPVAATGTAFALRFDKNADYASGLYVVTTLLAAITLPVLMAFY